MGASLSWLAVRGKSPQIARDELGLSTTGETGDWSKSRYLGAHLENGWYLIIANRSERLVKNNLLSRLSVDCEIVACFVEEHVMVSTSTQWQDGKQLWSITHNAQEGVDNLEIKGDPPLIFASIRDRSQTSQKTEDEGEPMVDHMFNIPVDMAEEITGFSHEAGGYKFELLENKGGNWLQKTLYRLGFS